MKSAENAGWLVVSGIGAGAFFWSWNDPKAFQPVGLVGIAMACLVACAVMVYEAGFTNGRHEAVMARHENREVNTKPIPSYFWYQLILIWGVLGLCAVLSPAFHSAPIKTVAAPHEAGQSQSEANAKAEATPK